MDELILDAKDFTGVLTEIHGLTLEYISIQKQKAKALIDFLEYEEALTNDRDTATRIRAVLTKLEVWK